MTTPSDVPQQPASNQNPKDPPGRKALFSDLDSISFAGLLLIALSAAVFVVICYLNFNKRDVTLESEIPDLVLFIVGSFSALLGAGLVRSSGSAAREPNAVINSKEWDLIKDEVKSGKEDAITQYIRLTSLTGVSGFFTKLGLTGLPLATIALTIFFSILYLKDEKYLDLAKLTLGAFIGSFVQKQVGASQGTGTVLLPSGEKVKVTPNTTVT